MSPDHNLSLAMTWQDEWFAYKRRKALNQHEAKFDYNLSAACLDVRRFSWTAGMEEMPDVTSLQEPEEEEVRPHDSLHV